MTRRNTLIGLTKITQAVFAARQAALGVVHQRELAVRDTLAALDTARADRAQAVTGAEADAAQIAGADLRWHGWIESRRATLNAELSRLRVAEDAARAALTIAFGRDQAAKSLVDRARIDRARKLARRDDATS